MIPENLLIGDQAFSDEFKVACAEHKITTMRQLITTPLESIYTSGWLSIPMIEEFFAVLDSLRGLEKNTATRPGNSDFII